MTCFECAEHPGPGGLTFSDRSAVGVCRHCGKAICKAHGAWAEATSEFLCTPCAARGAAPRS